MLIAPLFLTAKNGDHDAIISKMDSKMWYTHTMKYYLEIKIPIQPLKDMDES